MSTSSEIPRSRSRARRAERSMSMSALLALVGAGELDLHDGTLDRGIRERLGAGGSALGGGDLEGDLGGRGSDHPTGDLAPVVVRRDEPADVAAEVAGLREWSADAGRGDLEGVGLLAHDVG